MDRNYIIKITEITPTASLSARRAWIEMALAPEQNTTKQSLSARRAWIEISNSLDDILAGVVALRKESVDRNSDNTSDMRNPVTSLSARRAWIEIQ